MKRHLGSAIAGTVRKRAKSVIASAAGIPVLDRTDRRTLIETSQRVALADSRFLAHVRDGDALRDQQRWPEAAAAYESALRLHPWERSYWVQLGHMAKEQEDFPKAEIAYRTACALGAPGHDVVEHLRFVMQRQGADEHRWPVRFYRNSDGPGDVPAYPDVALFGRLLWNVGGMSDADMLLLLRDCPTLDGLVVTMCADSRFERAHRPWLELIEEHEL